MAAEIPGFYYDEEKNRYFPVKGPIPGSKSIRKASCASSSAKPTPPASATTGADVIPGGLHISPVLFAFVSALALTNRGFFFFLQCYSYGSSISTLVQARELGGNILPFRTDRKRRCAFVAEILSNQVSRPQVTVRSDNYSLLLSPSLLRYNDQP